MTIQAAPFDTHKLIKRLTASGLTEEQAEAIAESDAEAIRAGLAGDVATKADIEILRSEIKDVKLWLGGVVITVGVALAGFIAYVTNLILSAINAG